jgi:2-(1,2-epoxy-1,2-dihydrophenyl)acetyl-CoA isomerase
VNHDTTTAVTISREPTAATVQMNRPAALNALNVRLTADLLAALETVGADECVRAVCLTGAGRAFCSGADLREMEALEAEAADGRPDLRAALIERFNPITLALREMPKPVIAVVNGPCVGIGVGFALACDQVIAATSAYFLLPFVQLGLAPDGGASAFVPTRIGAARAAQLALSGRRLPAGEALEWGLIDEVVPDADLAARAKEALTALAAGPTKAYAGIKRQANAWLYPRLREQLALEADLQGELTMTADFAAGLAAFTARTDPTFYGT